MALPSLDEAVSAILGFSRPQMGSLSSPSPLHGWKRGERKEQRLLLRCCLFIMEEESYSQLFIGQKRPGHTQLKEGQEEIGDGVMSDYNFLLHVFWHYLNQTRY